MLIKNFILFFIFLTYLYNINYSFFPLHPMLLMGVIGGFLLVNNSLKNGSKDIYIIYSQLILLFLIPVFFLPALWLNESDYYYLREYFLIPFLMIFAGYFVIVLLNKNYKKHNLFSVVSNFIIGCVAFQCVISILMFLSPSLKVLLMSLVQYDTLAEGVVTGISEFRIVGFGTQFFGAGVINSIALVLLSHLLLFNKENRKYYIVVYILIATIGMAMSRTTLIGIVLSFGFFLYQKVIVEKNFFLLVKYLFIAFIGYILLLLCLNVIRESILSLKDSPILSFGFEMLINLVETGELSSSSSDTMREMYSILPDEFSTWIVGDGMFRDASGLAYYKHVDIGYLRIIFATGLLGLAAFIFIHFLVSYRIYRTKGFKALGIFLFFLILTVLLKGIMILYPIICLLAYSIISPKHIRNA